jgi:hypothetical protein
MAELDETGGGVNVSRVPEPGFDFEDAEAGRELLPEIKELLEWVGERKDLVMAALEGGADDRRLIGLHDRLAHVKAASEDWMKGNAEPLTPENCREFAGALNDFWAVVGRLNNSSSESSERLLQILSNAYPDLVVDVSGKYLPEGLTSADFDTVVLKLGEEEVEVGVRLYAAGGTPICCLVVLQGDSVLPLKIENQDVPEPSARGFAFADLNSRDGAQIDMTLSDLLEDLKDMLFDGTEEGFLARAGGIAEGHGVPTLDVVDRFGDGKLSPGDVDEIGSFVIDGDEALIATRFYTVGEARVLSLYVIRGGVVYAFDSGEG